MRSRLSRSLISAAVPLGMCAANGVSATTSIVSVPSQQMRCASSSGASKSKKLRSSSPASISKTTSARASSKPKNMMRGSNNNDVPKSTTRKTCDVTPSRSLQKGVRSQSAPSSRTGDKKGGGGGAGDAKRQQRTESSPVGKKALQMPPTVTPAINKEEIGSNKVITQRDNSVTTNKSNMGSSKVSPSAKVEEAVLHIIIPPCTVHNFQTMHAIVSGLSGGVAADGDSSSPQITTAEDVIAKLMSFPPRDLLSFAAHFGVDVGLTINSGALSMAVMEEPHSPMQQLCSEIYRVDAEAKQHGESKSTKKSAAASSTTSKKDSSKQTKTAAAAAAPATPASLYGVFVDIAQGTSSTSAGENDHKINLLLGSSAGAETSFAETQLKIRREIVHAIIERHFRVADEVLHGLQWEVCNVLTSGRGVGHATNAGGVAGALTGEGLIHTNSLSSLYGASAGGLAAGAGRKSAYAGSNNNYRQITAGATGRHAAQEVAIYLTHFEPIWRPVAKAAKVQSDRSASYISALNPQSQSRANKSSTTAANDDKENSETQQKKEVHEVIIHLFCPLRNTLVLSHRMPLMKGTEENNTIAEENGNGATGSSTLSTTQKEREGSAALEIATEEATSGIMASILLSDMLTGGGDGGGAVGHEGGASPAPPALALSDRQREWAFIEKVVEISRGVTKIICVPLMTESFSSSSAVTSSSSLWVNEAQQRLASILIDGGIQCACDVNAAGLIAAMLRSQEMRRVVQSDIKRASGGSTSNSPSTSATNNNPSPSLSSSSSSSSQLVLGGGTSISDSLADPTSIAFDQKQSFQSKQLIARMEQREGRSERSPSAEGEEAVEVAAQQAQDHQSQPQSQPKDSLSNPSLMWSVSAPLTASGERSVFAVALDRFDLSDNGVKKRPTATVPTQKKSNGTRFAKDGGQHDDVVAALTSPSLLDVPKPVFASLPDRQQQQECFSTVSWIKEQIDGITSSSSSSAVVPAGANPICLASLQSWFRGHWQLLGLCSAHSGIDGTPFSVLAGLTMPRAEVHAIHIIQHGSKGISIAVYSTATEKKRVASGNLPIIVRELLQLPTHHLILVPTERTDRQLLRQVRSYLAREGRLCSVIYPSMLMPELGGLRNFKSNFPDQFWRELMDRTSLSAADLCWELRYMAGRQLRSFLVHKDDALAAVLRHQSKSLDADEELLHRTDVIPAEEPPASEKNESSEKTSKTGNNTKKRNQIVKSPKEEVNPLLVDLTPTEREAYAALADKSTITADPRRWLAEFQQNPVRARQEAAAHAKLSSKFIVLGAMATDYNGHGRAYNPTLRQSRLLSAAWLDYKGQLVLPTVLMRSRSAFMCPDLSEYDVLVVHDAKAVLLHVWESPEIRNFIARGGAVWCTMAAEYLISGQQVKSGANTLLEVSMRHLPYNAEAAALFASVVGISRDAIPLSLHTKLLSTSVQLCRETFLSQLDVAKAQRQVISCSERMNAVLAMASMEHNGLKIDVEAAGSRASDINNRIVAIDEALDLCLPRQVPTDAWRNVDWTNPQFVRSYFFGGIYRLGPESQGRYVPVVNTVDLQAGEREQALRSQQTSNFASPAEAGSSHPRSAQNNIMDTLNNAIRDSSSSLSPAASATVTENQATSSSDAGGFDGNSNPSSSERTIVSHKWVSNAYSPLFHEIITQFVVRYHSSIALRIYEVGVFFKSVGLNGTAELSETVLRTYFSRRRDHIAAGLYLSGEGPIRSGSGPIRFLAGGPKGVTVVTAGDGAALVADHEPPQDNDASSASSAAGMRIADHRINFAKVYELQHEGASLDLASDSVLKKSKVKSESEISKGLIRNTDLVHREIDNSSLRKFRLFMFDVEATGLNAYVDDIVEIGFFDPSTKRSLSSLVRPSRPIPNRVTRIHQINQTMVKNAPTMLELLPRIIQFLDLRFEPTPAGVAACERLGLDPQSYVRREADFGSEKEEVKILMSHSTFALDEPLLRKAFRLIPELDTSLVIFADSVPLFKMFKRRIRNRSVDKSLMNSYRMSDLKNLFKIKDGADAQLHRAIDDAKLLWRILDAAFALESHRDPPSALYSYIIENIVTFPNEHIFVCRPYDARLGITISLNGVAHQYLTPSQIDRLSFKPRITNETLRLLAKKGCLVAKLLLEKDNLERHASRFLQFTDSGTLVVVHPDECVRQEIDVTATSTSRTTSSSPSCQNIPKGDDDSIVRSVYVSRFGSEGRCLEVDYGQLEVGVLAVLSNDSSLLKELSEGVDFHCKRAAFFEYARRQLAANEERQRRTADIVARSSLNSVYIGGIGLSGDSGADSDPLAQAAKTIEELYQEIYQGYLRGEPRYTAIRKQAKIVSFQRMYGGGVHLIHRTTNIPLPVLREAIEEEERQYLQLKNFYALVRNTCLRVDNPGLPTHFTFEMPTGFRISFDPRDVKHGLPPLKNYPVQGYSAELVQMMVGKLFRHFVEKYGGGKAFIVNFVHDSVWIDCHKSVLEEVTRDTVKILSDLPRYVTSLMDGVHVPIEMPVVAQAGLTFGDLTNVMRTTHVPHEVIIDEKALAAVVEDGGLALKRERLQSALSGAGDELSPQMVSAGVQGVHSDEGVLTIDTKEGKGKDAHATKASAAAAKAPTKMTAFELRKHREQLKKSLRRLSPVLDYLPDGVTPRKYGVSASASATSDPLNRFLLEEEEINQIEEEIADSADLE